MLSIYESTVDLVKSRRDEGRIRRRSPAEQPADREIPLLIERRYWHSGDRRECGGTLALSGFMRSPTFRDRHVYRNISARTMADPLIPGELSIQRRPPNSGVPWVLTMNRPETPSHLSLSLVRGRPPLDLLLPPFFRLDLSRMWSSQAPAGISHLRPFTASSHSRANSIQ